jgi:hypothetical protein
MSTVWNTPDSTIKIQVKIIFYGMHPVVYLLYKDYLTVSLHNNFSHIKQNKHNCVIICFYFAYVVITLHFSTLLLGHPQAYAIQALVTEINMNSYCVHN